MLPLNIIPQSEGIVIQATADLVAKELYDVLAPLADGWDGMSDISSMVLEAVQGAQVFQGIPAEKRKAAFLAGLAVLGMAAAADLLLIFPDEEAATEAPA